MNKIKFGLKLWSTDRNIIQEAKELIKDGTFDYIELMAVPDTDISLFKEMKAPFIIHIPHDGFGLNIADKEKKEFNLKIINQSIECADKLSAEYLILHPGFGQMEAAIKFLKGVSDSRILIENMTVVGAHNEKMIGYNLKQIKILAKNKFGFCLDFGHAIKAAISLKVEWAKFIEQLLTLQPKVFHVSDGTFLEGPDDHFNIGEGEYDFKFFLDCVKKNASQLVTLETPKEDLTSLKQDLENLKKIKNYLK